MPDTPDPSGPMLPATGRPPRPRPWRFAALAVALPCALVGVVPGAWAVTSSASVVAERRPADPVYPTQQEVDAAKAAAVTGAARVVEIEREYAAATDRLLVLQQEVSDAMAVVAAAQAELEVRTAALADAQAEATRAAKRRDGATVALRRDAALMYQDQSGGLGQLTAFLGGREPQEIADVSSTMGQVAEQRRTNLHVATDAANVAREATRRAEVARRQQESAKDAADEASRAAQDRADAALAESERIQAEQHRRVTELARLRNVAVKVEQDRQDGLAAEAARRAAEEAARRKAAAEAARRKAEEAARQRAAEESARKAAEARRQAEQRTNSSSGVSRSTPTRPTGGGGDARAIAQGLLGSYGWGGDQWSCLDQLWVGESGWNWWATNPSSGAYGIPQSLPASKMASAGPDWLTNPRTQIVWGMGYIKNRYGSPCAAWSFWLSQSPHWY